MKKLGKFMKRITLGLLACLWPVEVAAQSFPDDQVEAFFDTVATGGIEAVAEVLEKAPALATAEDRFGFQAIHVIDYIDNEKVLNLLLDYGADVDAVNEDGITLLHIVLDVDLVPAVLKAGANLEHRDNLGRTPLINNLVEPDRYDLIEAFLKAGANPNVEDNEGKTALEWAGIREAEGYVELLTAYGAHPVD